MPIYEYLCEECGRRQSFLLLSGWEAQIRCKRCGSPRLHRLISRVRVNLSEETRMERLADPSRWGDVDENDPRSMARFMKKIGAELGGDLGDDFHEMVDQLEAGELPDEDGGGEEEGDL